MYKKQLGLCGPKIVGAYFGGKIFCCALTTVVIIIIIIQNQKLG